MRRVAAAPYREMLRRLAAAGWPIPILMKEHAIPDNVWRDRALWVTPETAAKVQKVYDTIDGRLGPHMQTARFWQARGYLVPLAETPEDQLPLPPKVVDQRKLDAQANRKTRSCRRPRCGVYGCRRALWGREMCQAHYMRWRRTGVVPRTPVGPSRKRQTDVA